MGLNLHSFTDSFFIKRINTEVIYLTLHYLTRILKEDGNPLRHQYLRNPQKQTYTTLSISIKNVCITISTQYQRNIYSLRNSVKI